MNKRCFGARASALALAVILPVAPLAHAFDMTVSGFIRQEMAYKLNDNENPNITGGNKFNGRDYVTQGKLLPPGLVINSRRDLETDNDWNVFATKGELDFSFNFTNDLSGFMKVRGYYQPDVFDEVDDSAFVDGEGGQPSHFRMDNHGNEATYLSVSNDDFMLDIPALYLDWAKGPLWVRIGQQQIAWGEALFFRVADVPNGLDFRRHVIFDFGAEEYADERLSAPGIRASYKVTNDWEVEVFAQMFQPSILPPNYSPYNVIQPGFSMNYRDGFDKVDDQINGGIRIMGENLGKEGTWGVQFFAVSRHNPDPIFSLDPSGVNNPAFPVLPNLDTGELLDFSSQPFIYEAGGLAGTSGPTEWFYNSGIAGADGLDVINGLIHDFPWIRSFAELGLGMAPDANGDYITTINGTTDPNGINGIDFLELFWQAGLPGVVTPEGGYDALHLALGGSQLSGNMKVRYASENIFGFGFNNIFYAEPDTWLDQLVLRFEASYTPDKKYTYNLRQNYQEHDELLASLVLEKYHRFSQDFPATFLIFEYMFRKESDLLGRHLNGLGGSTFRRPGGGEDSRGWHGLVLAFQQPFPNLTWRLDASFLYDFEGGFLFQPAVRYKPNNSWTVETFVNIIDGGNDTALGPFDWSDDLTVRLTYQF